jgi:tRNA(adenine34) deaminase
MLDEQQRAEYFMQCAYQEALKALDEGEVPIGAVIVRDNILIGKGHNSIETLNDATAHAEIVAITSASTALNSWRLDRCTLYVTVEPCLMCLGAILQSRLPAIVYATPDPRIGAIDSFFYRNEIERSYHFFPAVSSGLLRDQCKQLLETFFKKIRKKAKGK